MKGHIRNIFPGGNTPQGFYSYYNDILPQRKAEKICPLRERDHTYPQSSHEHGESFPYRRSDLRSWPNHNKFRKIHRA